MTTEHSPDDDRLALAEVSCRIAHAMEEVAALREGRAYPAMPADRRAAQAADLDTQVAALQRRRAELAARVPDPEAVRGPDGTLPAERRAAHLRQYIVRRRDEIGRLQARLAYLGTVAAEKSAPRDVRRRARDDRSMTDNNLQVLRREPSDEQLRAQDMCPDVVHLQSSHGYVSTAARPVWPCAAWPGQQQVFLNVRRLLEAQTRRRQDHELTRWQLTLYCGHVVERIAHSSYPTYAAAGGMSRPCEQCGVEPSFVVDEHSLGPLARHRRAVG